MDSKIIQQNDILQDDILIEKHGKGKFEGFRFYANKNNSDPALETHNFADNDDLILAFSKRATRFCACSNGDFTLSSDGIVRWIGQPVGQLIATEDFLKPKLLVLADTQLTGEARDNVTKRLERFVTFHFETALKPLFDLRNADHLTHSTQDLALQLVHSLGILPRREVATIVKNLNQESRAVLRQLGVRFGAFHIYVAAMIKPAPVQAITLLWNLQNEGQDQAGMGEIFAALSAGRTSLVVNPTYNRKFYQLAGYRILGKRAVRIDMLERLANLIRPALHWKQGDDPKPEGAYDGKSFFVTTAMMSILGANGTDMEEILKGLGYHSRPMSKANFQQHLLTHEVSAHTGARIQDIPAAECVGDQWQNMKTLETRGEAKSALSPCLETQPNTTDGLPAAEPVGNFARQNQAIEEEQVILLWHYHHPLHHSSHKKREKLEHKWQNKPQRTFKKGANTDAPPQETISPRKHSYKSNAPHSKSMKSKPFQKGKRSDPDSPFAKLAALRDQLTNNKKTQILSSKEH
ncbi:hypothetical protein [Bartonella harrusi]|uniref:ATP-dependent helicase n=1 Tax=Bartonella harrusi TaxID=2961895 RepID=A0ABY5EVT1_9HYPH|nr:hypothetical protein [Bartonella harrusi]UTO29437.1 hypothetical protein NMK50_09010 [Bartonella harrusi]